MFLHPTQYTATTPLCPGGNTSSGDSYITENSWEQKLPLPGEGKEGIAVPCIKYSITNHPQFKMLLCRVSPTPLTKSEPKKMSRTPNLKAINHFIKVQSMKHLAGIETHLQKFLRSNSITVSLMFKLLITTAVKWLIWMEPIKPFLGMMLLTSTFSS